MKEDNETRLGAAERRPDPDPTFLTTQQLVHEVALLKELLRVQFDGYDKAIHLLQSRADKSPTIDVVNAFVEKLAAVTDEKFNGIKVQFSERDTRAEQGSRDSKVALEAALQAAKELVGKQNEFSEKAINKSELAMMKQMDQTDVLIATNTKTLDDKIVGLKERINNSEGQKHGAVQGWGWAVGIVGFIAYVVSILKP